MTAPPASSPSPDAAELAAEIRAGFRRYCQGFAEITRRAPGRFARREWAEGQEDARERILLYDVVVHDTLRSLRRLVPGTPDPRIGAEVREAFRAWALPRPDVEVAETFFNSVVRRLFGTIGVDPSLEFVAEAVDEPRDAGPAPWSTHPLERGFEHALSTLLSSQPLDLPWQQWDARLRAAADVLRTELGSDGEWSAGEIQVLRPLFFRNKAAYVVGRVVRGDVVVPLILALLHPPGGVTLEAVLPTADEASVVFGFTRSYLHADVPAPRSVVRFLRSILPHKREDELYTGIGFNRHGKTVFYRTLLQHLRDPDARFVTTPGKAGLVMSVFTLPDLNVVFKVIRDRFGAPKQTSPERVRRNYDLIFVRDRVGRLADAQEYRRLELPRARFSEPVLDELLRTAARTVSASGETVTVEHLYTERRVRPLDVYLEEAPPEAALRATLDFGRAIKDLAAADIFPGDMLVKNFGVTRHGRVIFYDYDEVALLTDCNIRERPEAAYPEAEMADAPPFYVGPNDLFPAEWRAFLGPPGPLRHELHRAHPELFDPAWWRDMQARHRAGEVVDFFPYREERRLEP